MKWEPGAFVTCKLESSVHTKGAGNDCRVVTFDWGKQKSQSGRARKQGKGGVCHFKAPVREVRERPERR